MNRLFTFEQISDLFSYKTILDENKNEYVVFSNSQLNHVQGVVDYTLFEAMENHVHLLDNVSKKEFSELEPIAEKLGIALLCCLEHHYPQKRFYVFVSYRLHDSLIIRFHQKWPCEAPYFDVRNFDVPNEKVLVFENQSLKYLKAPYNATVFSVDMYTINWN